jgi:hypothetical protein
MHAIRQHRLQIADRHPFDRTDIGDDRAVAERGGDPSPDLGIGR